MHASAAAAAMLAGLQAVAAARNAGQRTGDGRRVAGTRRAACRTIYAAGCPHRYRCARVIGGVAVALVSERLLNTKNQHDTIYRVCVCSPYFTGPLPVLAKKRAHSSNRAATFRQRVHTNASGALSDAVSNYRPPPASSQRTHTRNKLDFFAG